MNKMYKHLFNTALKRCVTAELKANNRLLRNNTYSEKNTVTIQISALAIAFPPGTHIIVKMQNSLPLNTRKIT